MLAFDIARDPDGLRTALLDLMEEGFAFSRVKSKLDNVDDEGRERLLLSLPERKLTPGYYKLGEYLVWLDQHIEAMRGGMPPSSLAFEVAGLCVLGSARAEFENNHPPCYGCGARQDTRFATSCHACGTEFKRS